MTRKGVRKSLVHRGGLRAEILDDGEIRVGDAVVRERGQRSGVTPKRSE